MIEPSRELPADTGFRSRAAKPRERDDALTTSGQRELGAIVADVWENAEKLVRQELELALAELDRRVEKLKVGVLAATVSCAALYAGALLLLSALVLGLSKVMEPWLAALLPGVVVTAAGVILGRRARHEGGSVQARAGAHERNDAARPDESRERTVRAMKEATK